MRIAHAALTMGAASLALGSVLCMALGPGDAKKKILFYSQSFGFRHSVVTRPVTGQLAHAEKILKELGEKAGYEVCVSQDYRDLENENQLKQYSAIVLYTTGNPLINRDALLKWLQNGGALVGIHTATDTFHHAQGGDVPMGDGEKARWSIPDWPEYTKIIGGAFKTHGAQAATRMKVHDSGHPAVKMIEDGWTITDEIYLFDRYNKDVHLLLSVDTANMDDANLEKLKMKKGEFYPVAWTNTEGKGRVFYTSLGHREDVWTNPTYQKHLMAGLAWALGGK